MPTGHTGNTWHESLLKLRSERGAVFRVARPTWGTWKGRQTPFCLAFGLVRWILRPLRGMSEPSDMYVDAETLADEQSSAIDDSRPSISIGSGEFTRVDRFTLLEAIGQGGMGELYAAYDAQLDRKVALKLVRGGRANDIADSRLLREAQALAQISHPNVVPVFDVGSAGRRVFVAMEYVRGQTLDAWLEDLEPDAEGRVDAILQHFRDAALGLMAVHDAGLAHRDFKPDNVIVGDDGRVRLVDFGLARSTKPTDDTQAQESGSRRREGELLDGLELGEMVTPNIEVGKLTDTGALLGTPRYMAPELLAGERPSERSDIYALGVMSSAATSTPSA